LPSCYVLIERACIWLFTARPDQFSKNTNPHALPKVMGGINADLSVSRPAKEESRKLVLLRVWLFIFLTVLILAYRWAVSVFLLTNFNVSRVSTPTNTVLFALYKLGSIPFRRGLSGLEGRDPLMPVSGSARLMNTPRVKLAD